MQFAYSPYSVIPASSVIPAEAGIQTSLQDISLGITKANKLTYYINNKAASTYHRYEDGRLELLTDYVYDDEGNLILTRLPYARDSIDPADKRDVVSITDANKILEHTRSTIRFLDRLRKATTKVEAF